MMENVGGYFLGILLILISEEFILLISLFWKRVVWMIFLLVCFVRMLLFKYISRFLKKKIDFLNLNIIFFFSFLIYIVVVESLC